MEGGLSSVDNEKGVWMIRGPLASHLINIKVKGERHENNGINTNIMRYKKYS